MVESAPLLREYRLTPIEGSNPSLSAILRAGVAQLVEHYLAKVTVVSSSLITRSIKSVNNYR